MTERHKPDDANPAPPSAGGGQNRLFPALLAILFVLELTLSFLLLDQWSVRGDEDSFLGLARQMLTTGELRYAGFAAYRFPLYPLLLAGLLRVGGTLPLLKLFQHFLHLGSALLVYRMMARRGERSARWCAIFFFLGYDLLFYINRLYSETLVVFLLLLGLWFLQRALASTGRNGALAGFALAGAAGILARGNGIFLFAAGLVMLWRAGRIRWRGSVALVVAVLAVIAPYLARNWRALGSPLLNTQLAMTMASTTDPTRPYYWLLDDVDFSGHGENDPWFARVAGERLAGYPGHYLGGVAARLVRFWLPSTGYEEFARHYHGQPLRRLIRMLLPTLYWAILLTVFFTRLRPGEMWRDHFTGALLLILAANNLFYALTQFSFRYRSPFLALLIMLAGASPPGWDWRRAIRVAALLLAGGALDLAYISFTLPR